VEKTTLKIINAVTIVLLLLFGIASFMVMQKTTESNLVTVDVARIQSQNRSRVVQEVALLTVEVKNLQKDMDKILETLKKIKKKNEKK